MDDSSDDAAFIPTLTEVITETLAPPTDAHAISHWLESRLQETLLVRAQQLIEEQVQREVEHIIARATLTLSLELRDAMHRVSREVIAQIISEEASRLKAQGLTAPAAPR